MKPKAVVFDIGNVLIEWQPERFFDSVIGAERRRAMFAAVDLHAMNDRVDSGETFHDVIREMADATPDWQDEIWTQIETFKHAKFNTKSGHPADQTCQEIQHN